MKAISSIQHEFLTDYDAAVAARDLADDVFECYGALRFTNLPDEVSIRLSGIEALTLFDNETLHDYGGSLDVRCEYKRLEGMICRIAFVSEKGMTVYRHNPERGWSTAAEEDEPSEHSDIIGELACMFDTARWPSRYLDTAPFSDEDFVYFVQDVLYPMATHQYGEQVYYAGGSPEVIDESGVRRNIALHAVQAGRGKGDARSMEEDYVYLSAEDSDGGIIRSQSIVRSAFGTASTETVVNGTEHAIEDADEYLALMRGALNALSVHQAAEAALMEAASTAND